MCFKHYAKHSFYSIHIVLKFFCREKQNNELNHFQLDVVKAVAQNENVDVLCNLRYTGHLCVSAVSQNKLSHKL